VTDPARDDLFSFCRLLADASGAVIRRHYRSAYTVEAKSDLSPVTVADREAEQVMRGLIVERFPDHGILGEEFGDHQPGADYQWVLDPIDGTRNFVSHSFLFGTLIALLKEGRPIVGAIHHPATGDFLIGDGRASFLNDRPARVRPCARVEDAVALTSSHYAAWDHADGPAYERLIRRTRQYNTWGDCHGYFLVATGGADLMLDPIMSVWDLMALIPVVEGAGGRITDWHGDDAVQGKSAIATAGEIHDEVVRALNP
jgi:myo-inositol-1(or 4)-monophosphatase